ncbi:MAG: N-acetylglucosamine-6-phosphate deacetylase [Chloroflexi bacterium]|nr:N-acetylglucosamine-6-phosphate deacetylase [Chloroflexota bacterium]
MLYALTGARILTPDEEIPAGNVIIEDGRIVAVGADVPPPPGARVQAVANLTLAPGFIDTHVHGGGGFSLATDDPEEVRRYARWAVSKGVTSFLATVCAASHEEGLDFLRTAAGVVGPIGGGAELLGVHLEGPFVSPQRLGALPEGWARPPNVPDLRAYLEAAGSHLRVITLAPELPGAPGVIEAALARGVAVSMGHSDATYEEGGQAIAAGVRRATHVFNALRPFHQREPGIVGAVLESPDVTAEVIADGVHVHPAAIQLLLKAKGPERVALVTDGAPPAGLSQGSFSIGGKQARLGEGRVVLEDGTLAGSAATMDDCVRNVVRRGVATMADAVRMASAVPAASLGCGERKGRIAPGYDADIVALDEGLEVTMTWVRGEIVYFWRKGWQG